MNIDYAFIKDSNVVNIAAFDDSDNDLLQFFKETNNLDYIVPINNKTQIGGTYDGTDFWKIQPFPSWIKSNEIKDWVPPIEPPDKDKTYAWDEDTLSWYEIQVGPAVAPE